MRLEREALVILLLIGVVLAPMWYFALVSGEAAQTVVLDSSQGQIAPNETFLPTPKEVNENVAGVITWVALFGVVAMMYYTHRFIHRMGRTAESALSEKPTADGGCVSDPDDTNRDGASRRASRNASRRSSRRRTGTLSTCGPRTCRTGRSRRSVC